MCALSAAPLQSPSPPWSALVGLASRTVSILGELSPPNSQAPSLLSLLHSGEMDTETGGRRAAVVARLVQDRQPGKEGDWFRLRNWNIAVIVCSDSSVPPDCRVHKVVRCTADWVPPRCASLSTGGDSYASSSTALSLRGPAYPPRP